MIEYRKFITRDMLQNEPEKLFVFGDNIAQRGLGGQAKEMRGEPNAVGIPTKKIPSNIERAFFTNTENDLALFIYHAADPVMRLLVYEGLIIWPSDGIGTGRAKLKTKAPKIFATIEKIRVTLEFSPFEDAIFGQQHDL